VPTWGWWKVLRPWLAFHLVALPQAGAVGALEQEFPDEVDQVGGRRQRARRNRPSSLPPLLCRPWLMLPLCQRADLRGARARGPVTPRNPVPRHSAVCRWV